MQPFEALKTIQQKTTFALTGNWQERELTLLEQVFDRFNASGVFNPWPYSVNITLEPTGGNCLLANGTTCLNSNGLTTWTIAHELAHGWDAAHGWQLSKRMRKATHSGFLSNFIHYSFPKWKVFWYRVGSPPPPCGIDKNFNAVEDFAESVTAYLYTDEAKQRAKQRGWAYENWGYTHFHETPRGKFIQPLMEEQKKNPPLT